VSLAAYIWRAYEQRDQLDELGWRINKQAVGLDRASLMSYLRERDPRSAVRELILPTMPVAISVADYLQLEISPGDSDDLIIDRFLWKLGFNLPRDDSEYSRLRERLDSLREVLLRTGKIRDERDRESIRSVGVNLFVSVEYFLEELIAYCAWLLSTDHFVGSRFVYDQANAVAGVASVLGETRPIGENEVAWRPEGGNTLGSLLVYLTALIEWLRGLHDRDRAPYERPGDELPHYADDAELIFPFRHKVLWADSDNTELSTFVGNFERIALQLHRSNLASVRNGLDHMRDEETFPTIDEMLASEARIRDALDLADSGRFIPKPFWLRRRVSDHYGGIELSLNDSSGRTLILYGPSLGRGKLDVKFSTPVVVAPGNLLGIPNAELVFQIRSESAYSRYWSGYPRRRRIPRSQVSDGSVAVESADDDFELER
jgi:hypothetical protein